MADDIEVQDFVSQLSLAGLIPDDPADALKGGIISVKVEEKQENGRYLENSVFRTDREMRITLKWQLTGSLLGSKFFDFPGNWFVQAFLEGWGETAQDHDSDVEKRKVDKFDQPSPWDYSAFIHVPPDTITAGAYRLAVTLTYKDEDGEPGPMAGFVEVPGMIQVYKPKS